MKPVADSALDECLPDLGKAQTGIYYLGRGYTDATCDMIYDQ